MGSQPNIATNIDNGPYKTEVPIVIMPKAKAVISGQMNLLIIMHIASKACIKLELGLYTMNGKFVIYV